MNVRFVCPVCQRHARTELGVGSEWQCAHCGTVAALRSPETEAGDLRTCALCGNSELYKKKDFPHWLGLTILTAACLGSIIPYWLYHQWLTWTILIGSALLDGLLYLWVGDMVVCYRCDAHYRDLTPTPEHKPFDLGIAERYRQERLRRQELQAAKKPNGR